LEISWWRQPPETIAKRIRHLRRLSPFRSANFHSIWHEPPNIIKAPPKFFDDVRRFFDQHMFIIKTGRNGIFISFYNHKMQSSAKTGKSTHLARFTGAVPAPGASLPRQSSSTKAHPPIPASRRSTASHPCGARCHGTQASSVCSTGAGWKPVFPHNESNAPTVYGCLANCSSSRWAASISSVCHEQPIVRSGVPTAGCSETWPRFH